MKRRGFLFLLCVALAAGCRDESREDSVTLTMPDPAPPPEPIRFRVEPVGRRVASPPPPAPRGQYDVMITGGMIEVTPVLPRKNIYLHVRNQTGDRHVIELSGGGDSVTAAVAPQGTASLYARLGEGTYELACTLPGHWERGRFETSEPIPGHRPIR